MTDCTRAILNRRSRWLLAFFLCLGTLAWGLASASGPALADGDPASDVLATQSLFPPQDAGIPAPEQAQLVALLAEAARSGYQLRVALIASATDLGSIGALWRQPASYAKFLGQELSLSYRGTLLVVMPDGFGVYDQGHLTTREEAALEGVVPRSVGGGMAATAVQAIRKLAQAAGHPLALPRAGSSRRAASSDPIPWIVFGLGMAAVAVAWAASLRARPLGSGPEAAQPRSA